ncbi:hypothetical protein H0H93_001570, partial [Arthromyces matolae]
MVSLPVNTSTVDLPIHIGMDDVPDLLARDPTAESCDDSKDDDIVHRKPNAIAIPHAFLPADNLGSTHELEMSVPGQKDIALWGSVVNILNLINAAVRKDTNLQGPRDSFMEKFEKIRKAETLKIISNEWNSRMGAALWDQNTDDLDLEALRKSIRKAVKNHNEFQGEIRIPRQVWYDNSVISMKVPYPNNGEAVNSVARIIQLMQKALANKAEVQAKESLRMHRLSCFR